MRKYLNFIPMIFMIFIIACNGKDVVPTVDVQTSYFNPEYHNEIAIFPTYKSLGHERMDFESSIAYRDYYVWEEAQSGKYILITVLTPKKGSFPDDIDWIDRDSAIYSKGNVVAYDNVHKRPVNVIHRLGGSVGECVIIAQKFYYHEKEVILKALIVPDEMCSGSAEPVVRELNRVANMQP